VGGFYLAVIPTTSRPDGRKGSRIEIGRTTVAAISCTMGNMVRRLPEGARSPLERSLHRHAVLGLGILLLVVGCASEKSVRVATATVSRYRNSQSAEVARWPLCSTPSSGESTSLAVQDRNNICMFVAKRNGIPIAYDENQRCLEATMSWRVVESGAKNECETSAAWASVECKSRYLYRHTLEVTLVDSEEETPVLESHAATQSEKRDLTAATAYALCTAAFFGHPQAVENKSVAVTYDK
jgi:hypothetical protein